MSHCPAQVKTVFEGLERNTLTDQSLRVVPGALRTAPGLEGGRGCGPDAASSTVGPR